MVGSCMGKEAVVSFWQLGGDTSYLSYGAEYIINLGKETLILLLSMD